MSDSNKQQDGASLFQKIWNHQVLSIAKPASTDSLPQLAKSEQMMIPQQQQQQQQQQLPKPVMRPRAVTQPSYHTPELCLSPGDLGTFDFMPQIEEWRKQHPLFKGSTSQAQ